jgi:serine/threonine protein kinase
MGAVLAATHLHLDERVAIKVVLPDVAKDPATGVRFLREARAAVKIKSEHVAKVHDFGQLETGQPYMVMEYLVGEDLSAMLERRGPLPVADAAVYLLQACDAIAQAHALGIVHRDLKPGNLFLTTREDGTPCVKVLDFGISKATGADGSLSSLTLTKTQSVVGSPMYMAPEQMRPNRPLDARTDIWSLGVVAYELLTGRLPFDAQTMPELCAMVLQDPAPPMQRQDLPPQLEVAIQRCLEKNPADRFADLSALAEALAPFASAEVKDLVLRISRSRRAKFDDVSGSAPGLTASPSIRQSEREERPPEVVAAETELASAPLAATKLDARTAAAWTGAMAVPVTRRVPIQLLAGAGAFLIIASAVALWVTRSSPAPEVSTATVAPSADPVPTPTTSSSAAATPAIPAAIPAIPVTGGTAASASEPALPAAQPQPVRPLPRPVPSPRVPTVGTTKKAAPPQASVAPPMDPTKRATNPKD